MRQKAFHLTAIVLAALLVMQGCFLPRKDFVEDAKKDIFWPLPPAPTLKTSPTKEDTKQYANDASLYESLVRERNEMVAECTVVFTHLYKQKKIAREKEWALQGSELGFGVAIVLLAIANPAANAAVISVLGAFGGLGWFTLWPFMPDVINTENNLVANLKTSHEDYMKAITGALREEQNKSNANLLANARMAIGKAKAACFLSKEEISPIPDKPLPSTPNPLTPPAQ